MNEYMYLIPIPFSIIACYTDIKTIKIKNYVTYPLIFLGIFFNTLTSGFEGFISSFSGVIVIGLGISLLSNIFKVRGGDIKLLMGYAAFLGYDKIFPIILLFFLLSTIWNISYLIYIYGIKHLISEVKKEIATRGEYKTSFKKIIGAPFIFGAYIIIILSDFLFQYPN